MWFRLLVWTVTFSVVFASGYQAYRLNIHVRQAVRVLAYDLNLSAPSAVLLVGDSRIATLNCNRLGPGWTGLNLGVRGLTAQQLNENLVSWIGASRQYKRSVLWIGINDILHHRAAPMDVAESVAGLIERLAERTVRVGVFSQIPILGEETITDARRVNQDLIELQNYLERRLASSSAIDRIDMLMVLPLNLPPDQSDYMDPIHLSDQGNSKVCARLSEWLARP